MFQYDEEESKGALGSILRQQREGKKLNIEEIAEELKIRPQYLEALENEQFELLPGKLYQRAFLKTYAQFLGLDQSHILKMFDQHEKSKGVLRKELEGKKLWQESIKEELDLPPPPQSKKIRLGYWLVILAILVIVIFGFIYLARPETGKGQKNVSELFPAPKESPNLASLDVDTSFAWRLDNLLTSSPEMILLMKAKKDSWVKVTGDEKTLFSGSITAGKAIEFKAQNYFSISLGTSEGLEIYLNGTKMRVLEKGIHHLDRKNYKSFFRDSPAP
jgi:transcriptional regulator with XRE-family HTH domain